MHFLAVGYPDQFDHAFKEAIRERAGALIVLPSVFYAHHLRHIAALARPNGLPAIFWSQQFAEVGVSWLMDQAPPTSDNAPPLI